MGWPGRKNGSHATHVRKPLARAEGLVVEEAGDEVLIYDEQTAEAHCLTRQAAAVWRACDGRTTASEMAAKLELEDDTVERALTELERCELLEVPAVAGKVREENPGVTRREATLRFAKVGAAAAAAPLIYSIAAPTPAMAQSQAFCLSQGCGHGCDQCFGVNCCCCCPGSGDLKHCTADCTTTNCSSPAPCPGTSCNGACHGGGGETNPCST